MLEQEVEWIRFFTHLFFIHFQSSKRLDYKHTNTLHIPYIYSINAWILSVLIDLILFLFILTSCWGSFFLVSTSQRKRRIGGLEALPERETFSNDRIEIDTVSNLISSFYATIYSACFIVLLLQNVKKNVTFNEIL